MPFFDKLSTFSLLILLSFLTACTGGGLSDDALQKPATPADNNAFIQVVSSENLMPAQWAFEIVPKGSVQFKSVNWESTDGSLNKDGTAISHVFHKAGLTRVQANYTTTTNITGAVSYDFVVNSAVVRGQISPADGLLIDLDSRDSNQKKISNDELGVNAQQITSPVEVGGNISSADPRDFFAVVLEKDQVVSLTIADAPKTALGSQDQMHLKLIAANNSEVEAVVSGSDRLASIVVPSTAAYYIEVSGQNINSWNGKGNYRLKISQPIVNSGFVPGQIVVMYKAQDSENTDNLRTAFSGLSSTNKLSNRIEVLGIESVSALMSSHSMKTSSNWQSNEHWQTLQAIELMKKNPNVLYAEPNYIRKTFSVNDPFFDDQWHYPLINLSDAWDFLAQDSITRGSSSVHVAVLDTGILPDHPDLKANLVHGYDFVGGNDGDPTDPGDKVRTGTVRSSFHGTHVAGTVAALADNALGGAGVAPGVKLIPVRVLDVNGGLVSDIYEGLCYVVQTKNVPSCSGRVKSGTPTLSVSADVINLSLGNSTASFIEEAILNDIMDAGVMVIAAAGNSRSSDPSYPAGYERVVSVSAVRENLQLASYSNFGSTIDLAAPGGELADNRGVLSTVGDDSGANLLYGYGQLQGTSMASPHVAGVAALMKSVEPQITHDDFRNLLAAGELTDNLNNSFRFGRGLINAKKSVVAAKALFSPFFIVDDSSHHLNTTVSNHHFTVSIKNSDQLTSSSVNATVSVESGIDWLSVVPDSIDSDGLGKYNFIVDRSKLGVEDIYSGAIIIHSDLAELKDFKVNITVQKNNPEMATNAGMHYVYVIPQDQPASDSFLVYEGPPLIVKEGQYVFEVAGLPKGRYKLFAGSNRDDDDNICDAGEACGAYPNVTNSEVIEVTEVNDLSGSVFEFTTTFTTGVSSQEFFDTSSGQQSGQLSDEQQTLGQSLEYETLLFGRSIESQILEKANSAEVKKKTIQ